MGRKGVSKRKPTKTKNPAASGPNTNSVIATIARASEPTLPLASGKSEGASTGKGGKKKSADSRQDNRKR